MGLSGSKALLKEDKALCLPSMGEMENSGQTGTIVSFSFPSTLGLISLVPRRAARSEGSTSIWYTRDAPPLSASAGLFEDIHSSILN